MDPITISIYHTNDLHGRIEALGRLSHFVRRLRAEDERAGIRSFFWDAGDAADRSLEICSLTKGELFGDLLDTMGYQLQTVGNDLALTYGPQVLEAYAARLNFPVLAANFRDGPGGPLVPGVQESATFDLAPNLTMGVFGLTAPFDGLYKIFGLDLPDAAGTARKVVGEFEAQSVSPVILLSHLGLQEDRELAETVDGIDLIVGAHSHDVLPDGEWRRLTLITQAGDYGRFVGRIELQISPETRQVTGAKAQVLEVPQNEPQDETFHAALQRLEAEAERLKGRQIGVLPAALQNAYFDECPMGDFAADALRAHMGADIAILMSGLLLRGLPAGPVTVGDLNNCCFTTANPAVTQLTGAEVSNALEKGLDPKISETVNRSFRGPPVGIPQISGMTVEFDPVAPVGYKIKRICCSGEDLDRDRTYLVAHTDAEVMDELGYFQLSEGMHTISDIPTILPEVLEWYLRKGILSIDLEGGRWQKLPR